MSNRELVINSIGLVNHSLLNEEIEYLQQTVMRRRGVFIVEPQILDTTRSVPFVSKR